MNIYPKNISARKKERVPHCEKSCHSREDRDPLKTSVLLQMDFRFRRNDNIQRGFTLLEILIALFIFTIISLIMVTVLHSVITAQSRTDENARYFSELQLAITILSRDLEQSINRQITNENAVAQNAFIGSSKDIIFTHGGLANPFGTLNRTSLQRTRYFLKNQNLIRETWPVLDITAKTSSSQRVILENVNALEFEYLNDHTQFLSTWPPYNQTQSTLPRAVRVYIITKKFGNLSQLFLLPGYQNAAKN